MLNMGTKLKIKENVALCLQRRSDLGIVNSYDYIYYCMHRNSMQRQVEQVQQSLITYVYPSITKIRLWILSDCPSLKHGIVLRYVHEHCQAMLGSGICELAHAFFHLGLLYYHSSIKALLRRQCAVYFHKTTPVNKYSRNIRRKF